ncbi:MAG: ABC transporter, permease protein 2 (cluster 1, maltose/g3p/polyamine/iron), partial [uncultured Rubellimicrobium sp.]
DDPDGQGGSPHALQVAGTAGAGDAPAPRHGAPCAPVAGAAVADVRLRHHAGSGHLQPGDQHPAPGPLPRERPRAPGRDGVLPHTARVGGGGAGLHGPVGVPHLHGGLGAGPLPLRRARRGDGADLRDTHAPVLRGRHPAIHPRGPRPRPREHLDRADRAAALQLAGRAVHAAGLQHDAAGTLRRGPGGGREGMADLPPRGAAHGQANHRGAVHHPVPGLLEQLSLAPPRQLPAGDDDRPRCAGQPHRREPRVLGGRDDRGGADDCADAPCLHLPPAVVHVRHHRRRREM